MGITCQVEDHGLSSSFFPFIVAEKDVCSEICTLESIIEAANTTNSDRNEALEFIHEMGWLLHRTRLKIRLGVDVEAFPFERFKWLIEFSVDHDWCAVVKKLLSSVDSNIEELLEIGLVHRAVGRNCRPMLEFLLNYCPSGAQYLFRPDAVGPGGLTPLHVAATLGSRDNILDALTDDPGSVCSFSIFF